MSVKRLRVFAGPNGSGKTTIIKSLQYKIQYGVYVNADDIESTLKLSSILDFNQYQLNISNSKLQNFFKKSSFGPIKRNETNLWNKLNVIENILTIEHTLTPI